MRSWIRGSIRALLVAVASISAMQVFVAQETGPEPVIAGAGATLSLDLDISDGACTDVDPNADITPTTQFQVGVCLSNPAGRPVAAFYYRVTYHDEFVSIPEVADVGAGLDDNPDANVGSTVFSSPDLGGGWDCTGGVGAYPKGDEDGVQDGNSTAFSGGCGSAAGPWALVSGPLGVMNVTVLQGGPATFTIVGAVIVGDDVQEIGSCNPVVDVPMTCEGAALSPNPIHCYAGSEPDDELRPNGPNVPDANDGTWPNADPYMNECESDDDNDGIQDLIEDGGSGCGGDSRMVDTDGDHLHDGWECANGSDPTNATSKFLGSGSADADGDRVPDLWEARGYNSGGGVTPTDMDYDGCHDLVEIASVDGNRATTIADSLAVSRRALNIWGPDVEQDWVLDIDANGVVGLPDRLFVARAALLPDWQPKTCP